MAFDVAVLEKDAGIYEFTLFGSLDSNTCTTLEKMVDDFLGKLPRAIVFNMEYLDYISSSGINIILKTKKGLKKNDGVMTIIGMQPQVKKVFDIIKAMPSKEIFSSTEELDRYLHNIQKKVAKGQM